MSIEKFFKSIFVAFLMISSGLSQSVKESFNYDSGVLDGLGEAVDGWAGPWEVFEGDPTALTIEDEGDLPAGVEITTTGKRLKGECYSDAGIRAYRPLADSIYDDGSAIWLSFLIETVNSITATWQGVSFWNPGDGGEVGLFGKDYNPTTWSFHLHFTGAQSNWQVVDNEPVWMVIKIALSGDDSDETVYQWINPDPKTEPSTDDADATLNKALTKAITYIACHLGARTGLVMYIDELRLGKSFKDVSSPITSVSQHENQFPNKFELSDNYPNPFNPSTQISYTIPVSEKVKLSVYNLLGNQIAVLVNERKNSGTHTVRFNAADLPSGMYVYKLECAGNVTTKKMLLLK
ncbi:MAG TPA: T9SS type A sorting domain-containing protein [Ignavibacteriaceae bacterium]|nr:T9SS type A sorting domain-containing protein [Ignavibacteriaceae bacterium]